MKLKRWFSQPIHLLVSRFDHCEPVAGRAGRLAFCAPFFAALMLCSCVVPAQQGVKTPESNSGASSESRPQMGGKLLKPVIPDDTPAPNQTEGSAPASLPQPPVTPQSNAAPAPATVHEAAPSAIPQPLAPPPAPPQTQPTVEPSQTPAPTAIPTPQSGRQGEIDKVRNAALNQAKFIPNIKKIKMCYAVKDDEWWIILYEQGDGFYELKQYTWNRDEERLESYLVLTRIPTDQLTQNLSAAEPGRACEAFNPA